MPKTDDLEAKLNETLAANAPKLSSDSKKSLVNWAPFLSFALGIVVLWGLIAIWQWAHVVNEFSRYAHDICSTYAGQGCGVVHRLGFWVWVSFVVLFCEALLYLVAVPLLRKRRKQGWNYLFYAALLSLAYACLNLLNGYGGVTAFFWGVTLTAIGLWLLFSIRDSYTSAVSVEIASPIIPPAPSTPPVPVVATTVSKPKAKSMTKKKTAKTSNTKTTRTALKKKAVKKPAAKKSAAKKKA